MTGPFGSGSFGTSVFSNSPLFTTKDIIDQVLRDTGHSSPSQETTKRSIVLSFINNRYARVTTTRHWDWLYQEADINFEAPYDTGTVSVTKGSAVITGSGTVWSADFADNFHIIISNHIYKIRTVDSQTQITLDSEMALETGSGFGYKIVKDVYQLPADLEHIQSLSGDSIGELVPLGTQEFTRKVQYDPTYVGMPRYYTEVGRRSEDGVRYARLYPSPDKKYQAHLNYGVNIQKLEDSDTNFPLIPDRHRVILYYGALSEMYRYLRDQSNAQSAENDFNRCMIAMAGDQKITDSRVIIANGKNYRKRRLRRGRYRFSMDTIDFSRWDD